MTAFRFLLISLVIHILLTQLLSWLHRQDPNKPIPPPVVVEIVDKSPSKARKIVKLNSKNTPVPKDRPKPDFLSEHDQFVKKQTSGSLDKNTVLRPSPGVKDLVPNYRDPEKQVMTSDDGPMLAPPVQARSLGGQEYVPNMPTGAITALNAERFTFYSFFSRIEEKVYPLWARRARYVLTGMSIEQLARLRGQTLVTKAEIILDAKGNYQQTVIFESCGIPALDATAEQAFREAAQFYNPPKEMVKADNKIHLYWAFIVYM